MQPITGHPTALRTLLSPAAPGAATVSARGLLGTYQGPFRDRVLQMLERRGVIADGAGVVDDAVHMIDGAIPEQVAAVADDLVRGGRGPSNLIFGGIMGRFLELQGLVPPGTADDAARGVAQLDAVVSHLAQVAPRI